MIEVFTKNDFKKMPWKNGGGSTLELYRIPHAKNSEKFLFRLSIASISESGPFSSFPEVERILVLLEGNGFELTLGKEIKLMNTVLNPLTFQGEESVESRLLKGPCQDFNIMTNRHFAKSQLSIVIPEENQMIQFESNCYLKFIYDIDAEFLYKLNKGDICTMMTHKSSPLFVIDVKEIKDE